MTINTISEQLAALNLLSYQLAQRRFVNSGRFESCH